MDSDKKQIDTHNFFNTKISDFLEKFMTSRNITTLIGLVSAAAFVLSGFYKLSVYNYYGIGSAYLRFQIQDIFGTVLINLLKLGVFIGFPFSIYKLNKSNESKFFKCIFIGLISVVYILWFTFIIYPTSVTICLNNQTSDLINNQFLIIVDCFIGLIGNCFIIIFAISPEKIKKIKLIIFIIGFLGAFLVVASVFCNVLLSYTSSEIGKKEFDTVMINKTPCAILTTYGDNFIVAPYARTNSLKNAHAYNDNYKTIIYSKTYKIISATQCDITHQNLGLAYVEKGKTFSNNLLK